MLSEMLKFFSMSPVTKSYPLFHIRDANTGGKCFLATSSNNAFMNKSSEYLQTLLICGPSGVGKGTLITQLLSEYTDICSLSVSHTSRPPRPGEINGTHYYFITKKEFERELKEGEYQFLETAIVHGNLYGTREDAVRSIHEQGKLCILDLDVKGVKQLKAKQYPMKTIFIAPPSIEILEKRLRTRATESEEQVQLRIHNAKEEVTYGLNQGNFDRIIVNDQFDTAYQELIQQMRQWFPFYFRSS